MTYQKISIYFLVLNLSLVFILNPHPIFAEEKSQFSFNDFKQEDRKSVV